MEVIWWRSGKESKGERRNEKEKHRNKVLVLVVLQSKFSHV
jgi:hypothetical protein